MRKWYIPLTLLGLGGLGAFLLSEPGRKAVVWVRDSLLFEPLQEWNENTERELARLEKTLDQLSAENLESA